MDVIAGALLELSPDSMINKGADAIADLTTICIVVGDAKLLVDDSGSHSYIGSFIYIA